VYDSQRPGRAAGDANLRVPAALPGRNRFDDSYPGLTLFATGLLAPGPSGAKSNFDPDL